MFSGGMYSCKHIFREIKWEGHIGQNMVQISVMGVESDTFGDPIFQKGLQN